MVDHERADLAADVGAVRLVEAQQRRDALVARLREVALEERLGQVGRAAVAQVHRQERDVGQRVGVAEALVELDAVEHMGGAGLRVDEYVVGLQVAVAVADPALVHARLEQVGVGAHEALDLGLAGLPRLAAQGPADERLGLLEVLVPVVPHRLQRAEAGDLRRAGGAPVEVGDQAAERLQRLRPRFLSGDQPGQALLLGQALHDDGDFFDPGRCAEAQMAGGVAVHGGEVEVDLGRDAAVELELGDRGGPALLERGEVEEAEVHRLLDLVDVVAGEEEV